MQLWAKLSITTMPLNKISCTPCQDQNAFLCWDNNYLIWDGTTALINLFPCHYFFFVENVPMLDDDGSK